MRSEKIAVVACALGIGLASSAYGLDVPEIEEEEAIHGADCLGLRKSGLFDDCGPFGVMCPRRLIPEVPPRMTQAQVAPLKGFTDLGPKDTTGDIDGPFRRGNGTYKVLENGLYTLSSEIKTGYMDIVFTLKRDTGTARDTASVVGRIWKDDRWVDVDGTNVVKVEYDPKRDKGKIKWEEDGEKKSEGFWRGEDDDGRMTIEFGGGYNHDFKQDNAPPRRRRRR